MFDIDQILNLSANPDEAHHFFNEFLQNSKAKLKDDKPTQNFLKIFGNSRFLSHFIIKNPLIYKIYLESHFQDKEKTFEVFKNEIDQVTNKKNNSLPILKNYKYQELLRLTIKELLGLNQEQTYRELSNLAIALTQTLLDSTKNHLLNQYKLKPKNICDFTLIAMGKLGGLELNYSSDIDLIGIYEKDENYSSITSHEFFVKLYIQLGQALSSMDHDGFLYRVDWNLRPEGKSGTLANSLNSIESYYEAFGKEWERQAFIKARIIWEQKDIGKQFTKLIQPFVYRKTFDEKTIHNVMDMKSKILDDLNKKNTSGINIKLGDGGIRDIEFFIQGFQLLYGGNVTALREQNTLLALSQLEKNDFITKDTKDILEKSYLFLRRVESCLQMENEQQTHTVKNDADHKFKLARRLGITLPRDDAIYQLEEDLTNVRNSVKSIFNYVYS